jgi:hypothetical protein
MNPLCRYTEVRPSEQGRHDKGGSRVLRAGLVLHQPFDRGPAQVRRQRQRVGLVHRAEGELAAVRRLQVQRHRLHAAALVTRLKTSGIMVKVEHLDSDGREP